MNKITKREFEVIALYSKGLTFKEIGYSLNIATRTAINYYVRVRNKSKGYITKARQSRASNKEHYKMRFKEATYSANECKNQVRLNYLDECLVFTYKSYHKFRLKNIKVSGIKVNS